jgi:hypothetical protein
VTLLAGWSNVGKSALLRVMRSVQSLESGVAQDFRIAFDWTVDLRDLQDNAGADIRGELESILVALPRDAPIRLEACLQQSGVGARRAVIDLSDLVNPQVGNLEISGPRSQWLLSGKRFGPFARRGQSPPGRHLWWSDGRGWAGICAGFKPRGSRVCGLMCETHSLAWFNLIRSLTGAHEGYLTTGPDRAGLPASVAIEGRKGRPRSRKRRASSP